MTSASGMKLWLLRPNGYAPDHDDDIDSLWLPWYDKAFGFVVRAGSEAEARAIAQANGADERYEVTPDGQGGDPAWLSPEHSTCVELNLDGERGVVLVDVRAA